MRQRITLALSRADAEWLCAAIGSWNDADDPGPSHRLFERLTRLLAKLPAAPPSAGETNHADA